MNIHTSIHTFLLVQLLIVSYLDFKSKKISNLWPLLNLSIFVLLLFAFPTIYPMVWKTFRFGSIFLGIGFILFALKIMGAGDVKYLTTYFLLLPFPYHGSALKYLLITTVIFASIMVAFKILSNFRMAVSSYFHQNGKFFYQMVRGKTVYAPIILLSHLWICLKH